MDVGIVIAFAVPRHKFREIRSLTGVALSVRHNCLFTHLYLLLFFFPLGIELRYSFFGLANFFIQFFGISNRIKCAARVFYIIY